MRSLRQECVEHGLENDFIYITYYSVQVALWRGDFDDAAQLVEQGVERALQQGGEVSVGAAMTWRAALGAYTGGEDQVRADVDAARAAIRRCGALMLERWPIAILGFLEVSLGNYEAALTALTPLLADVDEAATEICLAEFLPDAVESLVHLGRLDEAEPLVALLERNGRRLQRAWMLAVGTRCRATLLAAQGDCGAAITAAEEAMAFHEGLPMPFERARTQLLLGQLQRRQRHRKDATTTLTETLAAFEQMGTVRWAVRARAELARADVSPGVPARLTESEKRVAELVASGMTNRDVAAELFISPKTVEANLARCYRKLGIHSRAELARRITELEGEARQSEDA
jgi:DNA-binding CsgD family transcriptional regulator